MKLEQGAVVGPLFFVIENMPQTNMQESLHR